MIKLESTVVFLAWADRKIDLSPIWFPDYFVNANNVMHIVLVIQR